jgi:hypothetical protein
MLHLEVLEDGRTVVGDGHIAQLVHQHLIQTDGTCSDERKQQRQHECAHTMALRALLLMLACVFR